MINDTINLQVGQSWEGL